MYACRLHRPIRPTSADAGMPVPRWHVRSSTRGTGCRRAAAHAPDRNRYEDRCTWQYLHRVIALTAACLTMEGTVQADRLPHSSESAVPPTRGVGRLVAGGTEGNARLTAITGMVLIVL